ncbi:MAG: GtrA family protein [Patescibacteria group bacterium]
MWQELFKNQFIRFLIVGGINTLFGYGVFALLLFVGLHYALAAFLGTILGILFNFKTTGVIVFNSHNNWLIFKFFGVYGVTYILNVLGLYLFSLAQISAYIGGAILILPMAFVAFFLNKRFVFKI